MAESEEIFEIRLSKYERLRDTERGTRLAISNVVPGTVECAIPASISDSVESLLQNARKELNNTKTMGITANASTSQRNQATQLPFVGTPKLKGDHMSLVIDFDYEHVVTRPALFARYVTIQSTNLFDLLTPHPLNQGSVTMFLEKVRDYEPMAGDELRQFVLKIQEQYCRLRNQAPQSMHLRIVLAGIANFQSINKTYYSPLGREVREPAFLIHNIQINDVWQNLSEYKDLIPTGPQSKRLFTLANLFNLPCIFLDVEDGGKGFLQDAAREAQKLANDDWLRRATDGLVFTPFPKSGLSNKEKFWFKVPGATPVPPSWATMNPSPDPTRLAAEAARQDSLRQEAQVFAEKICTEETFERAWNMVTRNMRYDEIFPKQRIQQYMTAVWKIEHIVADEEERAAIDRSKVQPRIDRMARAWIMAKLEDQSTTERLGHDVDWVLIRNEQSALELTLSVRDQY